MTNIQKACRMRGITQIELARALSMSKQQVTNLATGISRPGPAVLPRLADALLVSAAYLRGEPQHLSVYDRETGRAEAFAIMSEETVGEAGCYYIADGPSGPAGVLLLRGRQYTPRGPGFPQTAAEIGNFEWIDADGNALNSDANLMPLRRL